MANAEQVAQCSINLYLRIVGGWGLPTECVGSVWARHVELSYTSILGAEDLPMKA
ncbi:MAG: hypothetical protein QW514_06300 [Thermoprotei archaeon]